MKLSERLRGYFDPIGNSGRLVREINEAADLLDECEQTIEEMRGDRYMPNKIEEAAITLLAKLRGELEPPDPQGDKL